MRNAMLKILAARATPDTLTVDVTWDNGMTTRIDLTDFINTHPVLAPLAMDSARFAQVMVGEWGWSLTWDQEGPLSIAGTTLEQLANEQSGRTMPREAFHAWMERNGLSLSTAAAILGLTHHTVSRYSSGARPIPKIVRLACKGYEADQRMT